MSKKPITKVVNRKPNSITGIKTEQKEEGIFMSYTKNIISQIVEAREEKEFAFICSQIQEFIEKENIDVCFVINKTELIDCLQEHQKLKMQISDLEAKLAESESELEKQKEKYDKLYGCYKKTSSEDLQDKYRLAEENDQLKQQLAEKEHSIEMLNQHLTDKAIEIERLGEELAENKKESDDYVMSAIETNVDLKNRLTQAQKERELDNAFWKQECDSLQKALVEKEKEAKQFKTMYFNKCLEYEHSMDKYNDKCAEFELKEYDYKQTIFENDQAKTDFAIEQLERAKNNIVKNIYAKAEYGGVEHCVSSYIIDKIDQQIKELKEGK